jgi:peroxiredoxin
MDFGLPLQAITPPNLTFGSFQGRKVLLFYFGPACPHCQEALPQVQAFADEIRQKGYETVAIATSRSDPGEIREFIVTHRCRLPVFWDTERRFGAAYDVKLLPTLYLVGPDGLRHRSDGFSGKATLDTLRSLL